MEFRRSGLVYDIDNLNSTDIFEIWKNREPRTLGGAYKRFCGKSSEDLHGAKEDVRVLMEVAPFISDLDYSEEDKPTEICYGQLTKDDAGELICNFGNKYKGVKISDIRKRDPGYLNWIVEQSNMSGMLKFLIYKEKLKSRS